MAQRNQGAVEGKGGHKARGVSEAEPLGLGNQKRLGAEGVSYPWAQQVAGGKTELAQVESSQTPWVGAEG